MKRRLTKRAVYKHQWGLGSHPKNRTHRTFKHFDTYTWNRDDRLIDQLRVECQWEHDNGCFFYQAPPK